MVSAAGVAVIAPPLITAFAVLKLVATTVVSAAGVAVIAPPLITAFAVLKLVAVNVVNAAGVAVIAPPLITAFAVLKLVTTPVVIVALPYNCPVTAPVAVRVVTFTLPNLTLANPLLLRAVIPVPVSVVVIAINAASASLHTNAALTLPYPANEPRLRFTKIPMSYPVKDPVYPLLKTTIGSLT